MAVHLAIVFGSSCLEVKLIVNIFLAIVFWQKHVWQSSVVISFLPISSVKFVPNFFINLCPCMLYSKCYWILKKNSLDFPTTLTHSAHFGFWWYIYVFRSIRNLLKIPLIFGLKITGLDPSILWSIKILIRIRFGPKMIEVGA